MKFIPFTIIFVFLIADLPAQQVDWLQSWPVAYTSNPGMPDQALASAENELIGMRLVNSTHIYGQKVYGEVSMDRLDPITGAVMLSCALEDSVTIDAITIDATGIGYFAGRFQGDELMICDGSSITGTAATPFTEHSFMIAWDLNADEILWSRNISIDHGSNFSITDLAIDPDGKLWYSIEDFFTGKVIALDSDGNDEEVRIIGGCKRIGAISFDPWGGLYVSGAADNGTFTFAGVTPPISPDMQYNMFVLRYRPDGSAAFAEFATDITFQAPEVVATNDGHAYLAGHLFDTTSWGGIPFNGPDWVNSAFIAKLDSTGQFIWGLESDPAGGPLTGDLNMAKGNGIAIDPANNVYLLGDLRGSVDWGNSVISDGLTLGAHSMTIVAFSPEGIPQWTATSLPNALVSTQSITVSADAIHFASHLTSEITFGSETTNPGGSQAAMVGRIGGLPTTIDDSSDHIPIFAWPNPATDQLMIDNRNSSMLAAELFDGVGRSVRSISLQPGLNSISVGTLSPGLYLLRNAKGSIVRVVKQ